MTSSSSTPGCSHSGNVCTPLPRLALAVATRGPAAPLWGLEARACQRGRGREGGGREEEKRKTREGGRERDGGREEENRKTKEAGGN